MGTKKFSNIKIVGVIILLALLLFTYLLNIKTLALKPGVFDNIVSLFGYLLIISLFVERSIEMFLSALRSQDADDLDRKIDKLNTQIENSDGISKSKISELNEQLDILRDDRTAYRAKSRFIALWIGLVIGIMVAMVGVRILGNIVDETSLTDRSHGLFTLVDVLITGSVLAGGSDSINKVMKVYNNLMNRAANKAKS